MRYLLLVLLGFSINCFAQYHEDPRFESPKIFGIPSSKVYFNCVLTDSLGVPIDLKYYMELDQDTIRGDGSWGEYVYYKSKYIKSCMNSYYRTGEKEPYPTNDLFQLQRISLYGDTLTIIYPTGVYKNSPNISSQYLGIDLDITIPNIGTMTIICDLKGYNPIFIEAPFQVGKFKVQYCEEDKIFKVNRPLYTLYHGEFVRLEEEKTIQEEEEERSENE